MKVSGLEPVGGAGNLLIDKVYASIKAAIQTMALAPGTPLRESQLSASLQVSKTPIREALGRLAQEGLTETTPFRGYRVTEFTAADARSVMELRAVLEGLAARRVCESVEEVALVELVAATEQAEAESSRGNWAEVSTLVHRVHTVIYENCGDARLRDMIEVLNGQFERARLTLPVGPDRLVKSVADHSRLLQAIRDGKPAEAEAVMRQHLVELIDLIPMTDDQGDAVVEGDVESIPAVTSGSTLSGVC